MDQAPRESSRFVMAITVSVEGRAYKNPDTGERARLAGMNSEAQLYDEDSRNLVERRWVVKKLLIALLVGFLSIAGLAAFGLIGWDYAVAGCIGASALFAGIAYLSLKREHPNLRPLGGGNFPTW
jgi:hypothetical protein